MDVTGKRGSIVVNETCLYCRRPTQVGLRIFSSLLCRDCEGELLQINADDPKYEVYVDRLRQILPKAEKLLQS